MCVWWRRRWLPLLLRDGERDGESLLLRGGGLVFVSPCRLNRSGVTGVGVCVNVSCGPVFVVVTVTVVTSVHQLQR